MKQKKYNIIYADPPWTFRVYSLKGNGRSAAIHYPTMNLEAIKDLPVEQLCAALDRELAEAVVISVGAYRNKTMGQLALEKPQALNWYLRDYKGPDNLIRAAAQVLLNAAFAA